MGVFPIINRINHSCVPNCSVQWNPVTDREELFTAREVGAGEELTICYLDMVTNVSSREERRDYLERHFGFQCDCPLCSLEGEELRADDEIRLKECSLILFFSIQCWTFSLFSPGQEIISLAEDRLVGKLG